jgi:hypothetical protein
MTLVNSIAIPCEQCMSTIITTEQSYVCGITQ